MQISGGTVHLSMVWIGNWPLKFLQNDHYRVIRLLREQWGKPGCLPLDLPTATFIETSILVSMFGQKDNRLHMTALSKHITTSYLFYLISAICQISQISCQRRGIAAYIDHPLGSILKWCQGRPDRSLFLVDLLQWHRHRPCFSHTVPEGLPLPFR